MDKLTLAILLFDDFTALDIIGPYEIFSRLPNVRTIFVGEEKRPYKDSYSLHINAEATISDIQACEILLIPGGFGIDKILQNQNIINWVLKIDKKTVWTTSVCSGSLLLASTGILDKKNCTTHWKRKKQLSQYNVNIKNERYVQDGKYVTSAGVSAGMDMALFLAGKITNDQVAQMIQLGIEYDPQPPFNCGSPDKAPKALVEKMSN